MSSRFNNSYILLGAPAAQLPPSATEQPGAGFLASDTGVVYFNKDDLSGWVAFANIGDVTALIAAALATAEAFATAEAIKYASITYVSPTFFGADPTGVIESGLQFRQAWDSMPVVGKSVFLVTPGLFRIATTVANVGFGTDDTGPELFRHVVLQGCGSESRIQSDVGAGNVVFRVGNLNGFEIDSLELWGMRTPGFTNCLIFGIIASCSQVSISNTRMQFVGADDTCLFSVNGDLTLNNYFSGGSAGVNSIIKCHSFSKFQAVNTDINDNGESGGLTTGSKVGTVPGTVIPAATFDLADPGLQVSAFNQMQLLMRSLRIDENCGKQAFLADSAAVRYQEILFEDVGISACLQAVAAGVPVVEIHKADNVRFERFWCKQIGGGSLARPALKLVDAGAVRASAFQIGTNPLDSSTIDIDALTKYFAIEGEAGVNFLSITTAGAQVYVKPKPDGAQYTTITLPTAADVPGLRALDTTTNLQLFSNGAVWKAAQPTVIPIAGLSTTLNTSGSPQEAGAIYFDPATVSPTGKIILALILSEAGGGTCTFKLFNVTLAGYVDIGGVGVTTLTTSSAGETRVASPATIRGANNFSAGPAIYRAEFYTSNGALLATQHSSSLEVAA